MRRESEHRKATARAALGFPGGWGRSAAPCPEVPVRHESPHRPGLCLHRSWRCGGLSCLLEHFTEPEVIERIVHRLGRTLGTVDEVTIERVVHRVGPLEHFTEPEVREIALVALAVMLAEDPARQRRDEAARESRERLDQLGRD
jgi:hypothetical protein